MLLDIFTSGKCHQNFRFATSYPGIKYFAKMCTMWQPCIVRYQRGFPGFQDSMWGIAFECEIHKSNVPKTKNPEAPFTTREQSKWCYHISSRKFKHAISPFSSVFIEIVHSRKRDAKFCFMKKIEITLKLLSQLTILLSTYFEMRHYKPLLSR